MKDKELALQEYLEMIRKSWTWGRLTEKERKRFLEVLSHPCSSSVIKGNYEERWDACEALYHTFLEGIGYEPLNWREEFKPEPKPTRDEIKRVLKYLGENYGKVLQN